MSVVLGLSLVPWRKQTIHTFFAALSAWFVCLAWCGNFLVLPRSCFIVSKVLARFLFCFVLGFCRVYVMFGSWQIVNFIGSDLQNFRSICWVNTSRFCCYFSICWAYTLFSQSSSSLRRIAVSFRLWFSSFGVGSILKCLELRHYWHFRSRGLTVLS